MPRLTVLLLALLPETAWAHGGPPAIDAGPARWTFDPWVVVPLIVALLLYATGFVRLRARRGLWRGGALYLTGWLVLSLSLLSPLHEAGERSFFFHMIEHEAIMLVAAAALPLSQPLGIMLWAFPHRARQWLGSGVVRLTRLRAPLFATALQAAILWTWHAPALFNRALADPGWHIAQHLSFLLSALLFWWAMLRTPHRALAALCLFITSLVGGALGALMALSASPWYQGYAAMGMMPFGLTPEEDQQMAGLVMWVPGGLAHAAAALAILSRYLHAGRTDETVST